MNTCFKCGKELEPNTEIAQLTTMKLDSNCDAIESSIDYGNCYCMDCYEALLS